MTTISPPGPATAFQRSDGTAPAAPARDFLDFRSVMAEQYEDWRELPEEQRIRHLYLEQHGLSEIGLDNLSDQDRAAHEEKIASLAKPLVFSSHPFGGAQAGDAMTRAVITLQSVLDTPSDAQEQAGDRTGPVGRD